MGNSQSVPSVDREKSKRPTIERRKLSKPRVGNHSGRREIPCLPPASAIIGGRVSKTKNAAAQGMNRAVPRQQTIPEASGILSAEDGIVIYNESSQTRRYSLSFSRHPSMSHTRKHSLTGSYRDTSLPLTRYNSSRKSTLTSQHARAELETIGTEESHPLPSVMRRRSQIFAAPPATKTRRQPTFVLEGGLPTPQLLALDLDRAQTPSGYSVLGVFKRGSLRIVNAAASPASSTQDTRPKRRNTTPSHPNASTCSVLLLTPTPQLTITSNNDNVGYFGHHGKLAVPNTVFCSTSNAESIEALTPLSFQTAPEEHCEVSELSKLAEAIQVDSHSISEANSAHLGDDSALSLTRDASINSSIHSDLPGHSTAEVIQTSKKAARRPSVKAGTDSGYCSTGSIRSWRSWSGKASDGDLQHGWKNLKVELGRCESGVHLLEEPTNVQTEARQQSLEGGGQSEVSLRWTDRCRLSATQEGPIVDDNTVSRRARKPSLPKSEQNLTHKRSFTQRLRSVVSSSDLKASAKQSMCRSAEDQWKLTPEGPDNLDGCLKVTHTRQELQNDILSEYNPIAIDYPATQQLRLSEQPQIGAVNATNDAVYLNYRSLRHSQSFTRPSRQIPSYTGAEYYLRFAIRRESMEIMCGTTSTDSINTPSIIPITSV